jgi:hypothetical protein
LGILNEFERRLDGLIEGLFSRAFKTGLHPVELANRILKEMESHKTIGVREVWVPNRYAFRLATEDAERFEHTGTALRTELEKVVREGARERGWALIGPPDVTFETDSSLRPGQYGCHASLVEGTPGWEDQPPPASSAPPRPEGPAELVLIERGQPGKRFPLAKDRVIIGRLAGSDIVLVDAGTSRRHAEIRREDGKYVIADLGSTNGTLVNHAAIHERALEEGDRITIGRTVLEFRRA